jgi:hypothetical protein
VHYLSLNRLGDGVTPGIQTQTQNSVAGALGYLPSNTSFYMEAAVTDTNWDPDHFEAVWSNPQEHRSTECSVSGVCGVGTCAPAGTAPCNADGSWQTTGYFPYVEIDGAEAGVFARDAGCTGACNSYYGMAHSLLDWPLGSHTANPLSHNNYNFFGAVVNHTQEHIYGMQWNASTQVMTYYQDGVAVFSYNASAFSADILNKHYYMIIGPQSHGADVPYSLLIRYMSAWM